MKATCKHPIEWDKRLFNCEKIEKDYREITNAVLNESIKNKLIKESEKSDIWENGLSKLFKKNNFYFVNPIYFLNHLENAGLFEFNPYENLSPRTPRFYSAQGNITFKDNPGFVPYRTSVFENKYKEGDLHQGNFYYPEINVGFNIMTDASYGLHMGIDFPGETGTKIKALVYGKVWACTWDKSIKEESGIGLGRVMIIKGNDNLMYLLCHLSGFIKDVGDDVFPGEDVAYVGNTGNSFGSHLHLEVHKTNVVGCELQKKDEILDKSKTVNMKEPNGQNGLRWKSSYTRKRVNPFNHEEVFKND